MIIGHGILRALFSKTRTTPDGMVSWGDYAWHAEFEAKRVARVEQQARLAKHKKETMCEFREVGETFNFLGVKMVVMGHEEVVLDRGRVISNQPKLMCNYINAAGEVVEKSFTFEEIHALETLNSGLLS